MSVRLPPKVGHVFQLAGIIGEILEEIPEGTTLNPTKLAQKILSDPRSQWAPAQEDQDNG